MIMKNRGFCDATKTNEELRMESEEKGNLRSVSNLMKNEEWKKKNGGKNVLNYYVIISLFN